MILDGLSGSEGSTGIYAGTDTKTLSGKRGHMMSLEQPERTSLESVIATKTTCFHYKRSKIMAIDLGLTLIALNTVLAVIVAKRGEVAGASGLIAAGYGFLLPLYIVARLGTSTICVDENAISCTVFGYVWKTIEWRNVRAIRMMVRAANLTPGVGRALLFTVDQSSRTKPPFRPDFLPSGPVAFSDEIVGSRALLDLINIYAVRYQIPIRSRVTASGDLAKEVRLVERL